MLPERSPILEPPGSQAQPTDVAIGLHIINIASIDEVAENFQIDGYLLMRWKDVRLEFKPAGPGDLERHYAPGQIWAPKIEMINAASPREKYDISIAVSPEGVVNYAERCKAVLSSKFELRRFPFDAVHMAHRSDRRRDLGLRIRRFSRWSVPAAFVISNMVLIMHFLT